jgi:SecD/SecF fusion protein
MDSEGTRIWRQMTVYNIDRQIAISIDNVVYDHPLFHNRIENGKSSITGNFTGDEVKDLASILNSGMYPVKLDLVKTEIIEAKK